MLLTILLSTLTLAPTQAMPVPGAVLRSPLRDSAGDARRCLNAQVRQAEEMPKPAFGGRARPLAELPPGNLYLSVVRHIDHCGVPTIIKYGIGGDSGRPGRR